MRLRPPFRILALLLFPTLLFAQPEPGDWYREYTWTLPGGEQSETFLRVGGHFDYRKQRPPLPAGSKEGGIRLPFTIDLNKATRAEVSVEKTLCHDHTTGLAIALNGHAPHPFPDAPGIPAPANAYMHHFHPVVAVPLAELRGDGRDEITLSVDPEQPWNWPQNLIYAVTVRLYYETPAASPAAAMVPLPDGRIGLTQRIEVIPQDPTGVRQADFIAHYCGPDMGGDGIYEKWHFYTHRGEMQGHLGSTAQAPFAVVWNTEWIPDQEAPIEVAALLTFEDGMRYFVPPTSGRLERSHSVELCRPYDQPEVWVTRNGRHGCHFDVFGDLNHAEAFRIVWRSWSPGYLNGLYLNDFVLHTREGDTYAYAEHRLEFDDLRYLHAGTNTLSTGMTPRFHGELVHGAEIFWPGPMVLIKYDPSRPPPPWHHFAPKPAVEDLSASVRGAWNPDGLVFLIEVTDPEAAAGDRLDLLLRTDPVQVRDEGPSDEHDFLVRLVRGAAAPKVFCQQVDQPPLVNPPIHALQSETATGWRAAVLLPWEWLELSSDLAHEHPLQLGFELSVADQDGEDPVDFLNWAGSRQVAGNWIEHNRWGLAELVPSAPGTAPSSRVDWSRLPSDEPIPVLPLASWGDAVPWQWEALETRFAAQPPQPLEHWLPSH